MIVTGGTAGALSKQVAPDDQPRDGRGGLKLITMFSYLGSVRLIGEVVSREREREVIVVLLAFALRLSYGVLSVTDAG